MQLDVHFLLSQLAIHHHCFLCGERICQAAFPLSVCPLGEFHGFLGGIHFRREAEQFAVHALDGEVGVDVKDRFLPARFVGKKLRPRLAINGKLVDSPWAIERRFGREIAGREIFLLSMRRIQSISGKEQTQRELTEQQDAVRPGPPELQLTKRRPSWSIQDKKARQPL